MRRGQKDQIPPASGAFRQALDGAMPAAGQGLEGVARETLADKASFAMGAHLWNATQAVFSHGSQVNRDTRDKELAEMPSGLLDILP